MRDRFFKFIKKMLRNNALLYLSTRYLTFFFQFCNSLMIAKFLGPYYLGLWGFFTLFLQYISFSNFGIQQSSGNLLSIHFKNGNLRKKIYVNSFWLLLGLILLLTIVMTTLGLSSGTFGEKYQFSSMWFPLLLAGIANHFIVFYSNVYRLFGNFFKIAVSQSLAVFLTLLLIIFYKGHFLLHSLVLVNVISSIVSVCLFVVDLPIKFSPKINLYWIRYLIRKGWHVFIYNTSFYFMVISTKSFVSSYYSVKQFGLFTFSFTISNTLILLLSSINYLIYPKILNRFAKMDNTLIMSSIEYIRSCYTVCVHFFAHIGILIFPVFLSFFPQYTDSLDTFRLIMLVTILMSNSFGISGFIVSKGRENILGKISFVCLLLNVVINYSMAAIFKVGYQYIALGTGIAYLAYTYIVNYVGLRNLSSEIKFGKYMNFSFSPRLLVPYLLSVTFVFLKLPDIYFTLPLCLFLTINLKNLRNLVMLFKRIVNDPSIFSID